MRAPTVAGRRVPRATLAALVALGGAGCVTTYEPIALPTRGSMPDAVPVTIPFPEIGDRRGALWNELYKGVLQRLQEAAEAGDPALIDALLASYDKPDVPESIADQLRGYRLVARGIAFQQHLLAAARLLAVAGTPPAPIDAAPPLGEALRLELRVPPGDEPVVLGGRYDRDPVGFAVAVTLEDEFVDGSSHSSHSEEFLRLPHAVELAGDRALTLPIEIGAAAGEAVRRKVLVRVDLMPGYVVIRGLRAPVKRTVVGAGSWTQWPRGHDVIAKTPLAALRQALAKFHEGNFASAYVAALLVRPEQRDEAIALLIDQVRFGRADQAQVAMAALRQVSGVDLPVGDRDAWLAWWQGRR